MRILRTERRRGPSRRIRIILVAVVVALFLLLISLRGIARFYTDYLWFDALGFEGVWSGLLAARFIPAVVFTVVFFVILLANLVIADRVAPAFLPAGPEEEFVQRYREVITPYAGRVRIAVAIVFSLIAGGGVSARWHEWILFRNRVDFRVSDPQFDTDVGFYVFQLPFLEFLFEWTFAALIIVFLVTAVAHYLNGGIRVRSPLEKVTPAVKVHLSVLLAVIAVVRAAGYWLERYELNFSTRGAVHGAGYTDVNWQLPALHMLIFISLVGALLFIGNIWRRGWVLPVLGVGLWAFVSLVIGQIVPAVVQRFQVEPNEFSRESQFIDRNIDATRTAYGLDEIEVKPFDYGEELTSAEVQENLAVFNNVRLWDPEFLDDTYRQLQRIRNFYKFDDVDIDRYEIDGNVVQTVLSARELDLGELPQNTWINRHLVFTHGYGMVVSPANAVTPDGEPQFLVKDIPPESDSIPVTRPEIYYGEATGSFAIVLTEEEEFDFPRSEAEREEVETTRYEGEGGVHMDNVLKRAAFGLRFADFRFFFSGELTQESRIIFERDVRGRVEKAAPFLKFDADPYPVVIDGEVEWVIDAYTTTEDYPYSQAIVPDRLSGESGLNTRLNYARNSVKATVDAYDGTVTFYVVDDSDPLIQAYQKAFPDLFTDASEIPDELRAHFRYPEDLFRIQTDLYSIYHMEESRAFYNRSDQWAIATDPGSGPLTLAAPTEGVETPGTRTTATAGGRPLSETATGRGRMDPYYLLMRLPGDDTESFVLLQPFSPPARQELGNLLAFMVARSDPADYGRIEAFVMPRGEQVFGPTQVNSQINTTTAIAEQITLLNEAGSQVIQGSLQLIPVEDSILYVRPLYVQAASGATQFPQLQFVIAFFGGDAVMETSLDAALARLFEGIEPPPDEETPDGVPEEPDDGAEPQVSDDIDELLSQAEDAFEAAEEALREGDLATYQQRVEEARQLIQRALAGRDAETGEDSDTESTTTTSAAPESAET